MSAAGQLLTTKLFPPSARPKRIARPRLLARLDENRPLTLIAAPAGFGKTTLLGDWVNEGRHRVAWLSLDEADNYPAQFWSYVITALQQTEPDEEMAALVLLQSPQQPSITSVLSELINQLAGLPQSLVLVLDDYHVITAQPIHQALSFLLEHLPA